MTTALVTGAAGFIGSHLIAALTRDATSPTRVVAVDAFDPFYGRTIKERNLAWRAASGGEGTVGRASGGAGGPIEVIEADVRDGAAMRAIVARVRPDVVYHLAALVGVRPSIDAADRYVDVNVGGLVSVLEAVRRGSAPPTVLASSSSVYGNGAKVPFAEDDEPSCPVSPYAATKVAGELLCQTYAGLHGMRIGCTRLFTVFGPRQRPDLAISRFLRAVSCDEPIPVYGDGSSSRDYTYVDDVVAGLRSAAAAVAAAPSGFVRTWNLGGARPVTLQALIDAIAAVTAKHPRIERLPHQPGDVDRTFADLTRARAELGYRPQVGLEEGLRRQWAWMQEEAIEASRREDGTEASRHRGIEGAKGRATVTTVADATAPSASTSPGAKCG